ncbi:ribosomal maturation YjgA family protein [Zunongwangia sp. HGR-M22]|uniref:ribosomal maturation YjgA family protein n=1 Tax=Zunongwangia sp. HGR-M22 TaxID=3015168 RepID=UPI0022DE8548|nr:DUF2809 domain-containing protein [Zunongwangia sp. HGR-M22]WBL25545.1 DUF2809 domain-containing protein [Zunongwangia sp. HGR-M22]
MLFALEILIASFVNGGFIRNVLGDYIVVFLIYYFFLSFLETSRIKLAIFVLFLAYTIELLQYINILKLLKIKRTIATTMILGSSFDWLDMLAYTLAFLTLILIARFKHSK